MWSSRTVVPYQEPSFPSPDWEWWVTSNSVVRNTSDEVTRWNQTKGTSKFWTPQNIGTGKCVYWSVTDSTNRPYPGIRKPQDSFLLCTTDNVKIGNSWVIAYSRVSTSTNDGSSILLSNRTGTHADQSSAYFAMTIGNIFTMQPNYGSNLTNHLQPWSSPASTDLCIVGWSLPSASSINQMMVLPSGRAMEQRNSLGYRTMTGGGGANETYDDTAVWSTDVAPDILWRSNLNPWANNRIALGGHNSSQVTDPTTLTNQNRPIFLHSVFQWSSALSTRQLIDFGLYLKGRYQNQDVPT